MVEKKSLTLYWSKNGNTEKVARRIHETLQKAGIEDSIFRMTKDLEVEYLDYNLVFFGAPVYENLPPKPVIAFLKKHRKRGVEIIASAPEKPGIAAIPYCTYGGGHTGYNEAVPMLKYIGQFFEHEGIRVVDDIAVPGIFPETDESYNTKGRFGIITDRPTAQDLREVEGRVLGILRRLHLILPLGDKFL
ncbi:MAG: flavodoxin domain-containing protein [Spirochaetia bacterium]